MTPDQLKMILSSHEAWLRKQEGGERADLKGADLEGANLTDADLRGANLSRANLKCANLKCANLRGASLRAANLRAADLSGAGLSRADLRAANLTGANLSGANLRYAGACLTNLRWANLCGADLLGADLEGANLCGADLSETSGIRHVSIAADWHGECGRKLLAVDHGDKEGVVIYCGCFRGGWDDLGRWIEEHDECERVTASRRAVTAMLRVLWDARGEYA